MNRLRWAHRGVLLRDPGPALAALSQLSASRHFASPLALALSVQALSAAGRLRDAQTLIEGVVSGAVCNPTLSRPALAAHQCFTELGPSVIHPALRALLSLCETFRADEIAFGTVSTLATHRIALTADEHLKLARIASKTRDKEQTLALIDSAPIKTTSLLNVGLGVSLACNDEVRSCCFVDALVNTRFDTISFELLLKYSSRVSDVVSLLNLAQASHKFCMNDRLASKLVSKAVLCGQNGLVSNVRVPSGPVVNALITASAKRRDFTQALDALGLAHQLNVRLDIPTVERLLCCAGWFHKGKDSHALRLVDQKQIPTVWQLWTSVSQRLESPNKAPPVRLRRALLSALSLSGELVDIGFIVGATFVGWQTPIQIKTVREGASVTMLPAATVSARFRAQSLESMRTSSVPLWRQVVGTYVRHGQSRLASNAITNRPKGAPSPSERDYALVIGSVRKKEDVDIVSKLLEHMAVSGVDAGEATTAAISHITKQQ